MSEDDDALVEQVEPAPDPLLGRVAAIIGEHAVMAVRPAGECATVTAPRCWCQCPTCGRRDCDGARHSDSIRPVAS